MLRTLDPAASAGPLEPVTKAATRRVRTPRFPPYDEVRHLLPAWAGRHHKQVTGLEKTLKALRGTYQDAVNWSDPDTWISERLTGEDRELAQAIWEESEGQVNPRHTYGHWLLSQTYELLEGGRDGILVLTERGRTFLDEEGGSTEAFLDEQEGVLYLLTLIDDLGPTRRAGLLEEWTHYLNRYSRFKAPSVCSDTLRRRLTNLLRRGLVRRDRAEYTMTAGGADYLFLLQQGGARDRNLGQRESVPDNELRDRERDSASAEVTLLGERETGRRAPAFPQADEDGAEIEGEVEPEPEDPASEHIDTPFDPSKIHVRTRPVLVEQLVSRLNHQEIDLAPDFQRLRGIWPAKDKSRLIESLLLRIPIPVFYVNADTEDNWQVVDGVQRISTMTDFVLGEFPLKGLEYLLHLNDKSYRELPRPMQRRISETPLTVNVIEPGTPQEVMFNIFHRINTGGRPLNHQEIRHALHPGPAREYLVELAASEEFMMATGGVARKRMKDRECALRFLAFHMRPWEEYSAPSLDAQLGAAMRELNQTTPDHREALAEDFRQAMRAAHAIFGRFAFRKRESLDDEKRRPLNLPPAGELGRTAGALHRGGARTTDPASRRASATAHCTAPV